ncbi:Ig-like domain-containing protein [Ruminococcus bromii]|uniref:Ig-like domain-containing protein n=1 Tax=Ruminococcus bromii TaxID=40518 RepID=UPI00241D80F4|nr:Ig-like domain-containing protein [Ruminococcus bromii]
MEEPTSVSLNKTSLTLDVGKSYTLTKTVSPSNAVTSYTWSSSNTSVATVDKNGKVTAKASGTATITVKTSNGKTANCKVTVNLPAPQITSLANTTGGIKISWNKVSGAYGYRLYYKPASGGWKRFKDTTATSFTDSGVVPNKTETYTIRCIDKNGKTVSGFNSKGWSKKYTPVAPTISKLDNTSGGIKLTWNKIAGAYGYRLYYKPASGGWKRFKDTTATSFTDSGVSPNRTETYTIRCIDKNGNTISGFNSNGWSKKYTPVAPTISKLENTSGGIKISWNKIAGVYGYRLYYKTSSGGWKRFKDTTATSFTDSGVSPNRTETYTIRCIDKNGKTVSGFNSKGWSKKYTAATPKITKLTNRSKGVSVTWNKIAGVYGYRLYRKYNGGSWTKVKDTTSTSFTDSGAKKGKKVTYTVRCIDRKGKTVSGFNSKGWSITRK